MYCLVVIDDYSGFTWVFFLATKDETSGILKSFITGIENLVDHKVKFIRCDNGTEFKNREMNQFCEMKGILRQFSAEAVNTACYVQNRVLVVKPHNKTPYELFHGRTPTLSFMRPFGCLVTILNTIDHLGKFDGMADECFFVGYFLNSKAFRVFNSRTRIVEENLHIRFSESTPNVVGSGPDWLFDIDALTRTMNYEPIVAGTQSNGFADPKSSHDDGSKPSSDDGKKVDEDLRKESECKDQEKEDNVNSTNNVNTVSLTINVAGINEVNVVGGKTSIELPFDPNMPALEDDSIFDFSRDDEDDGVVADMNNLDTTIQVSPNPTTRIHKDHPLDQVIGDLQSATQTRKMSKNLEEHGFVSTIQQRTNHKDLQNCLFACFLSQEEPKKVIHALKDPSWIEAMQEELLQFKLQEVWTLVDLPNRKRAIGFKWVFKNKKDERGIVIRNKARLVAQGYTQEEGIDYDEVFAPIARIKAIRLFLAYASFKDFVVYQMDVKSAFLYGKIEEEVYVCQPPGFEDPDFPDRVYKVEKALYGLHQAPRAWYETLSTYLLDNGFQRGKIDKTLFIKRHKGDILLVQVYVDDIIFGSTKKELCNAFEKLMHEKFQMSSMGELTFFLGLQVKQKKDGIFISQDKYVDEILKKFGFTEVKTASTPMETQKPLLKDEDGEEVDVHMYRSMIGSLIYLTSLRPDIMFVVYACAIHQVNPKVLHLHAVKRIFRLISWQCKKQTVVANSTAKAEYVAASRKAKKSVKLKMEKLFRIELELMLAKTINGEEQLHALVDGKKIIITESSVRRDLQLADKEDKVVHKELGDSLVRAATTTSSSKAEQDSGNITKTRSKATPNESSSIGTTSGGGPRCQVTMGDTIAHTRVLDLEKKKTTQANKIASLKRRVKKLEKKNRSRTHKLKRLYKVGLTARVESFDDEESLGEGASKQGKIDAIDANEEITLVSVHDMNVSADEEVVEEVVEVINTAKLIIDAAQISAASDKVSTASVATTISAATTTTATINTVYDITLAQALEEMKSTKHKKKGVVIQELEIALNLQAEFNEEERLARETAEKEKEANIALIETWDDIQANIDDDH
ncbi:putative ribonuclease H-like domain-containing protein [Tanacetum coccineum]